MYRGPGCIAAALLSGTEIQTRNETIYPSENKLTIIYVSLMELFRIFNGLWQHAAGE